MVTIIVVTWNSRDVIGRCISSIRESGYSPLEVILVDNASSDGTVEYVEKNFKEVITIKNTRNAGFSFANNQGIKMSRGEYILFLNPDAALKPDFLDILIKQMDKDLTIGVCGGKIYKDEGEKILDSTGISFSFFKIGPYDRGEGKMDTGQYNSSEFVSGITCACALYRRRCLEDVKIGNEYFDETYFAYYEDVDLAWRAREKGWRCLYVPEAIAYHRRSGKAIKNTPLFSRAMANLYLTYIKNESGFGLLRLALFKIPHEIGRILFRVIFRGKASYRPAMLESLRLGKNGLKDAIKKRKIVQKK
jgi:GT2 family glycosyltransferase